MRTRLVEIFVILHERVLPGGPLDRIGTINRTQLTLFIDASSCFFTSETFSSDCFSLSEVSVMVVCNLALWSLHSDISVSHFLVVL